MTVTITTETPAATVAARPMNRREVLLGGALLATAAITFARMPRERIVAYAGKDIGAAIPKQAGIWRTAADGGLVLPPEDEQRAAAVYEDQLARNYMDAAGRGVMFLMAYDRRQSGMLMVHRPESCYPGSGFEITANRATPLPLAPGVTPECRFLSTVRGERVEQVLYWTRLGNSFPASWDQQRRSIALQNLHGLVPDGALVRLSMISNDPDDALAVMKGFAATLFRASGRDGRALLAGPANA